MRGLGWKLAVLVITAMVAKPCSAQMCEYRPFDSTLENGFGAQIGHRAVNDHVQPERVIEGYEERCKTRHEVSYEEVLDGYDVTYEYRGREYRVVMPYDPGRHIKMRVQFSPVI